MQSNFYVGIFLLSAFFMITPTMAYGQVRINEIAWMGTEISHNHQWIELYNTSDDSIDLTGWKLMSVGSTPQISLEGNISAGGYFLLERTSDDSVPHIPADIIYTGALVNAGEHLRLIDAEGQIIDEIDNSDGWIAGDNNTKETMQRTSTGWITAPATPKSANATEGSSQTESTTTDPDQQESDLNISTDKKVELTAPPQPDYTAEISLPSVGTVGVPLSISGEVYRFNDTRLRGYYRYIMGDDHEYLIEPRMRSDLTFTHTYMYPGTYIIALEYRTNNFENTDPLILATQSITINEPPIEITEVLGDGSVRIDNASHSIEDISGWHIGNAHTLYTLRDHTYIAPQSSLILSSNEIKDMSTRFSSLSLFTPMRSIASTYSHPYINHTSQAYYEVSSPSSTQSVTSQHSVDVSDESLLSERIIDASPVDVMESTIIARSDDQKNTTMPWGGIIGLILVSIIIGASAYMLSKKVRLIPDSSI